MVNNSIQLFIAGFLENKKSLIFSDFIIVGSNSLQLITISYLPMQNVYFPTQTIFVLCKSLYINGEFF